MPDVFPAVTDNGEEVLESGEEGRLPGDEDILLASPLFPDVFQQGVEDVKEQTSSGPVDDALTGSVVLEVWNVAHLDEEGLKEETVEEFFEVGAGYLQSPLQDGGDQGRVAGAMEDSPVDHLLLHPFHCLVHYQIVLVLLVHSLQERRQVFLLLLQEHNQ